MVIKVNQSNLRLWVVHSLRRRIAAADIESEQPLTFRWCEISRCNMEGSGKMFSVFFTTKKCCSSGWLHVFDVAITPGILFYCALAADTIKSGKKRRKEKGKRKNRRKKEVGKKGKEGKKE